MCLRALRPGEWWAAATVSRSEWPLAWRAATERDTEHQDTHDTVERVRMTSSRRVSVSSVVSVACVAPSVGVGSDVVARSVAEGRCSRWRFAVSLQANAHQSTRRPANTGTVQTMHTRAYIPLLLLRAWECPSTLSLPSMPVLTRPSQDDSNETRSPPRDRADRPTLPDRRSPAALDRLQHAHTTSTGDGEKSSE